MEKQLLEEFKSLPKTIFDNEITIFKTKTELDNLKQQQSNIEMVEQLNIERETLADGKKKYTNELKRKGALREALYNNVKFQSLLKQIISCEEKIEKMRIQRDYNSRRFRFFETIFGGRK